MFSTNHFIWLAICFVVVVVLTFCSIKFKFSLKVSNIIICLVVFAGEIVKIYCSLKPAIKDGGMVIRATSLPLHFCSIMIFVYFYMLISKKGHESQTLKNFVAPMSLLGGILAILIPASGVSFNSPAPYQCFLYHAGMVWFGLYLLITRQAVLGIKPYLTNMAIIGGLAICSLWVNSALQTYNTNFFFTVRPPMKNLPILNLNNGWFAYFMTLVVLGIVLLGLVHLPYIIKEIISKVKSKQNINQSIQEEEKTPD